MTSSPSPAARTCAAPNLAGANLVKLTADTQTEVIDLRGAILTDVNLTAAKNFSQALL